MITLGSLFDGIGGFPLCAAISGVTPVWAAEVKSGRKPLETGKGFPYKSIAFCEGAAAELQNTIQMLEHYIKICADKPKSEIKK